MNTSLRRRLPLVAAAALGLALPAHAAAATPYLSGHTKGPKGYTMYVSGSKFSQGGSNAASYASVSADKSRGSTFQDHNVSRSTGVSYSANAKLTKATLKSKFGKFGSVSMKFTGTGKVKKSLPKGCKGTAPKSRTGVLKGTMKVRFKKSGGYIKRFRMPATLSTSGQYTCTGGGGPGVKPSHGFTLNSYSNGVGALSFFASRNSKTNVASQSVSYGSSSGGISVNHSINSSAKGKRYLAPNADLTKATARGIGPYLVGTLTYTSSSGSGSFSNGTIGGTLKARFDFVGTKTVKPASGSLQKF